MEKLNDSEVKIMVVVLIILLITMTGAFIKASMIANQFSDSPKEVRFGNIEDLYFHGNTFIIRDSLQAPKFYIGNVGTLHISHSLFEMGDNGIVVNVENTMGLTVKDTSINTTVEEIDK